MQRGDDGKTVYRADYVGLPAGPLPLAGDFDAAIADRDPLRRGYEKAARNAVEAIAADLAPAPLATAEK